VFGGWAGDRTTSPYPLISLPPALLLITATRFFPDWSKEENKWEKVQFLTVDMGVTLQRPPHLHPCSSHVVSALGLASGEANYDKTVLLPVLGSGTQA
jgi:hypothetical protein